MTKCGCLKTSLTEQQELEISHTSCCHFFGISVHTLCCERRMGCFCATVTRQPAISTWLSNLCFYVCMDKTKAVFVDNLVQN